jgi:hypothetical protein
MPFEVSFSAANPLALRFDIEPYGRELAPQGRRLRALAWWSDMAASLRAWPSRSQLSLPIAPNPRFGAFVGFGLDQQGIAEVKVYLELGGAWPSGSWRQLPRFRPVFLSLVARAGTVTRRLYAVNEADLETDSLRSLLESRGLDGILPHLALYLPLLTGASNVPARTLVVGLDEESTNLKLDVVVPAGRGRKTIAAVRALLVERDGGSAALDKWHGAIGGPVKPSVASLRLGKERPVSPSIYVEPGWGAASVFA